MARHSKIYQQALLPHLSLSISQDTSPINPLHPSFEVTDSIFAQEHSNFVTRLSTPTERPKIISMRVPGTPLFSCPNPHEKCFEKEDIYLNPTALYLSRKPLAYKRVERKASVVPDRTVSFTPALDSRKKSLTKQYHKRSVTISHDTGPLKQMKTNSMNKHNKTLHQEALMLLNQACEEMETFPKVSPKVEKAKKILDKYVKNVEWTSSILKNYSEQESSVLRQLYIISENSKNELDRDMAKTAEEIRRGSMDPALRHKKRKLIQL